MALQAAAGLTSKDCNGRCSADAPNEGLRGVMLPTAVAGALAQGLDVLAHGIALFDAAGTVRYANATARSLMNRWADKLSVPSFCLTGQTAGELHSALERVCLRRRRELLLLPVGDVEISIALLPVDVGGQAGAIAVFGRDEICGPIELLLFSRTRALTHAESRVLGHLSRGLTARTVALLHGVAQNTILTQIAAIRDKTDSNSVRGLMDTLAKLPPLVALSPVRAEDRAPAPDKWHLSA